MRIFIYQVDAFADRLFGGNPAAVCPLEVWLDEEMMHNIAPEDNLSDTAFYVKKGEGFDIRWFTPRVEINLVGHPTLATAHTLLIPFWAKKLKKNKLHALQVSERGGELFCECHGDRVYIGGKAITYLIGELRYKLDNISTRFTHMGVRSLGVEINLPLFDGLIRRCLCLLNARTESTMRLLKELAAKPRFTVKRCCNVKFFLKKGQTFLFMNTIRI